jgi:hemerythrin-like metal-binding protein
MALLEWTARFSVQIPDLDRDHREIFACLNELWLVATERPTPQEMARSLRRVVSVLRTHFGHEEAVLEQHAYPKIRQHIRQHQVLLNRLDVLIADADRGGDAGKDASTLDFIGDWLCSHILKSDRDYADFITRRDTGHSHLHQTLSRFCQRFRPGPAMRRLMLTALSGLAVSLALSWGILQLESNRSASGFHEMLAALSVLGAGLLSTAMLAYYTKVNAERMETAALFAREIARAKQRLNEAQRIARLGCIERDPVSGLWQLSNGTQAMLGIDPNLSEGSAAEVFANLPDDDRHRLLEHLEAPAGADLDIDLHVDGRILLALGEARPADPDSPLAVITLQDVTQRRAAERDRAAMIERMAEANRLESLGTLAGGVAHEINTPAQYIGDNLTFIRDWLPPLLDLAGQARTAAQSGDWGKVAEQACALRYEFAAEELPEAAEQALEGIGQISTIVQAIKEFSYPSGKVPQAFNLNRAVEMAATVTRNQWKDVARLRQDLAPDLPSISAIEGEINQILVNLIVNAADAIAETGTAGLGLITVQTRLDDGFVELSVTDTGAGIAPENVDKIFELFFTTKPPGSGTGQGLAITKAIVLRHGGRIKVESEPGAGATFRIHLPIPAQENHDSGILA